MRHTHHRGGGGAHTHHCGAPQRGTLPPKPGRWGRLRPNVFRFVKRKWVRRSLIGAGAATGVLVIGVLALWWRLNSGPIGIDLATPWIKAAISENFGGNHSVSIGGTQIERDHGRTSVRIL